MYSDEKKKTALNLLKETKSVTKTIRILGYPTQVQLYAWVKSQNELPKSRKQLALIGNPPEHPRNPSMETKLNALKRCFEKGENIRAVSEDIGYSRNSIYKWRKRYLKEGTLGLMNNKSILSGELNTEQESKETATTSNNEMNELKKQMQEMQLELDVLKETIHVLKKDPGINKKPLCNKEKTVIVDALKNKYSLQQLFKKMNFAKSSYFYQRKILSKQDKYLHLRVRIKELFIENKNSYGYRRIHALLKRENTTISEKIVREIMTSEVLVVLTKKTKKYNSYAGEITPSVSNKIKRNFSSNKPNIKWLSDITELAIPAGKVYLSPIIDCFDGLIVAWEISQSPNSNLVNSMLDNAINLLSPNEKPILHTDRGVHYRWDGWIERMGKAGLVRSMSKKGCSADNSACEGLFGRLKNEMFYNRDWADVSISDFINILNDYIVWYNKIRIKKTLGYMSPMEYRRSLGLVA